MITGMPSAISVNTDSGKATATVTWTAPTASDNSGGSVTLVASHGRGGSFPIGTTSVTYTADDVYGNSASDSFAVTVTGKLIKCLFLLGQDVSNLGRSTNWMRSSTKDTFNWHKLSIYIGRFNISTLLINI